MGNITKRGVIKMIIDEVLIENYSKFTEELTEIGKRDKGKAVKVIFKVLMQIFLAVTAYFLIAGYSNMDKEMLVSILGISVTLMVAMELMEMILESGFGGKGEWEYMKSKYGDSVIELDNKLSSMEENSQLKWLNEAYDGVGVIVLTKDKGYQIV